MPAPFEVKTTPTFEEFLRLNQYVIRRRFRWILLFFIVLGTAQTGFLLLRTEPKVSWDSGALAMSLIPWFFVVLLAFGIPASVRISARKRWNAASALREPRIFRFTETGIEGEGESVRGSVSWTNIARAETVGNLTILQDTQSVYFVVPEASFGSAAESLHFKEFLRTKVRNCTRLR